MTHEQSPSSNTTILSHQKLKLGRINKTCRLTFDLLTVGCHVCDPENWSRFYIKNILVVNPVGRLLWRLRGQWGRMLQNDSTFQLNRPTKNNIVCFCFCSGAAHLEFTMKTLAHVNIRFLSTLSANVIFIWASKLNSTSWLKTLFLFLFIYFWLYWIETGSEGEGVPKNTLGSKNHGLFVVVITQKCKINTE